MNQNASAIANKPVNAMKNPDSWEARATPAFALLDPETNGGAGDGSNTDLLPCVGSVPSCCFKGVGDGAALAVSDG